MFTEITVLLQVFFGTLKEHDILSGPLHKKGLRSVLHLYFLLDEIIESAAEYLHLAKNGTNPDVVAELEMIHSSPSEEMQHLLASIACNTQRFCEQIISLQRRLNTYLPEIPREIQLRRFQRRALVQWWIRVLDDERGFNAADLQKRLQHVVPDDSNVRFPMRKGYLNIIIYAGSTNPEYLSTRNSAAITTGEKNVSELEALRDELGQFIRETYDIQTIF
ncbi:MAG: hypothetical protein HXS46_18980 [Theionarchaea archaeon]|nr:hypothetical protein [Theionarchaea archaeon]